MNTATKVVLVLGAIFLIGGIAMFAVGVGNVGDLEEATYINATGTKKPAITEIYGL